MSIMTLFNDIFGASGFWEISIKAGLLLFIALLIGFLGRRLSASLRHLVFCITVIAVIILPAVVLIQPLQEMTSLPPVLSIPEINIPIPSPTPEIMTENLQSSAANIPTDSISEINWGYWGRLIWLLGTIAITLHILIGLVYAGYFYRGAVQITDASLVDLCEECRKISSVGRHIRFLINAKAPTPFAYGVLRPAVILPFKFMQWSPEKQKIVLLHELAHLKRLDVLSTLLSQLALVLYWTNPLYWLVSRRFVAVREQAADDYVLSRGIPADKYARSLAEIAFQIQQPRGSIASFVAMACNPRLEKRLKAIMDKTRSRKKLSLCKITGVTILAILSLSLMGNITTPSIQSDQPEVSIEELAEMLGTIGMFYDMVNYEYDFDSIQSSFLTSDFFADRNLTLEFLPDGGKRAILDNTIRILTTHKYRKIKSEFHLRDYGKEGHRYFVTFEGYISAVCSEAEEKIDTVLKTSQVTYFMERQNDILLIDRIDGPLQLKRMDINNSYGPIFITTIDDPSGKTPEGPFLFKYSKFNVSKYCFLTDGLHRALRAELLKCDPDLMPALEPGQELKTQPQ